MESGLMAEPGLESVKIAKENGSWTLLDSAESLEIPLDLDIEFKKRPGSEEYFLSLSKSIRKGMLQWIALAKRPETRSKRIKEIAENVAVKTRPGHFG